MYIKYLRTVRSSMYMDNSKFPALPQDDATY